MSPGVLNLTWSRPEPDVAVVALSGDLDHDTADRLLEEVTEAAATRPQRVGLDCADLAFCDSHGLAVLLMVQRRLAAAGVELTLDRRSARLDRLLQITGTTVLLTGSVKQARSQT